MSEKTVEPPKIRTLGELPIGTIVNYCNNVWGDDEDFEVIEHYEDVYGKWTKVLNLQTKEIDEFVQHTRMRLLWHIKKEITES